MTETCTSPPARKIARLLERAVAKAVGTAGSSRPVIPLAARLKTADRTAAALVFGAPRPPTA